MTQVLGLDISCFIGGSLGRLVLLKRTAHPHVEKWNLPCEIKRGRAFLPLRSGKTSLTATAVCTHRWYGEVIITSILGRGRPGLF